MELAKIENELALLPVSMRQSVAAFRTPKAMDVPKERLYEAVHVAVLKSYQQIGFTPKGDTAESRANELQMMVNDICRWILRNFPGVKVGELQTAFELGIHKKLGDFIGLSVITFCNFLENYYTSKFRSEAVNADRQLEESLKPKPTQEELEAEQDEKAKAFALDHFKTYAFENENMGSGSWIVYDYLAKHGYLSLEAEAKRDYFEQAKTEVYREMNLQKQVELNPLKRKGLEELIHNFSDKDTRIVHRAKMLAVLDYYRSLAIECRLLQEVFDEGK